MGEGPLPAPDCPALLRPCQLLNTAEQGRPWHSGKLEWGPQGNQPQPHPDHMLSLWAPPGGRKSV